MKLPPPPAQVRSYLSDRFNQLELGKHRPLPRCAAVVWSVAVGPIRWMMLRQTGFVLLLGPEPGPEHLEPGTSGWAPTWTGKRSFTG